MPESRVGAMLLVTGAAVMGLLILRLRQANRRLKASQKEVQRLKDELRTSMQSSRQMKPPETIDMNVIEPKLYAALRRQRPELPLVYRPGRAESLWSQFDRAFRGMADNERGLADILSSIQTLVCKFCELNADDFKWENDYDHKPDAASMQEARQAPMPDIRSGLLFCKVLEYEILSRRTKILSELAAQRGASPRVATARGDGPASVGGSSTWIAAALQSSRLQLFKYTHSTSSPRRPANELNESVTLLTLLNDHVLRPHTKAAIDLFCAGGYLLMRALTRLIIDQPPDVLPEFLFKALKISPESLSAVKTDEVWGKSSQLQSPVFLIATSSLSDAVAQSPGANVLFIVDTSASRSSQAKFSPARKHGCYG